MAFRSRTRHRHRAPVVAAVLLAALALALWPALSRGEHGELDVQVTEVVQSESGELIAIVSVLDHGRPLPGLAETDFAATEDGQPASIVSVASSEAESIPLSIVITLDTSGSMEGSAMSASIAAASEFVSNLAAGDRAAILSFSDTVTVVEGFSDNTSALLAAIGSLQAVGNTALYDAVAQSAAQVSTATTARKAVLLLSDGEDFGELSSFTANTSLAAAEDSGAIFYVVGVGDSIDTEFLTELATRSGGRYFAAPEPGDIVGIYRSLSEHLRGQYIVRVQPNDPSAPGRHTLSIAVTVGDASGVGEAPFSRAAEPTPLPADTPTALPTATPPAPTATAVPAATTGTDDSGGGGSTPLIAIGTIVMLGGFAAGGFLYVRRRGSAPQPDGQITGADEAPPAKQPAPQSAMPVLGELKIAGPDENERCVSIGTRPLTVGSAPGSDVTLRPGTEVAARHLRLWWRDGRLMLHHLDRSTRTRVNGEVAEWVALQPGDCIAIGDYQLFYQGPQDAQPAATIEAPQAVPSDF